MREQDRKGKRKAEEEVEVGKREKRERGHKAAIKKTRTRQRHKKRRERETEKERGERKEEEARHGQETDREWSWWPRTSARIFRDDDTTPTAVSSKVHSIPRNTRPARRRRAAAASSRVAMTDERGPLVAGPCN